MSEQKVENERGERGHSERHYFFRFSIMPAIDNLIKAKKSPIIGRSIQRARRKGDTREWNVVRGQNKKVYLKYGTTYKAARVWLKHLTTTAHRSGALGANSSVNSNTIEVLVGFGPLACWWSLAKLSSLVAALPA
jgi:hypothetical protein